MGIKIFSVMRALCLGSHFARGISQRSEQAHTAWLSREWSRHKLLLRTTHSVDIHVLQQLDYSAPTTLLVHMKNTSCTPKSSIGAPTNPDWLHELREIIRTNFHLIMVFDNSEWDILVRLPHTEHWCKELNDTARNVLFDEYEVVYLDDLGKVCTTPAAA